MIRRPDPEKGLNELREVRRESRGLFWFVGIFSFFVNLLMLTGPIFMLQVYDRVLGSRSQETLLALFILMGFLFLMMGLLDFVRGRVLARIGARFQRRLDQRVFAAVLKKSSIMQDDGDSTNNLRDLEAVQRLLASPVFAALFDIPWTPVFLVGIAIFHPWLGMLAIVGGGIDQGVSAFVGDAEGARASTGAAFESGAEATRIGGGVLENELWRVLTGGLRALGAAEER